eukprot:2268284-Rhodomonas_salina.2
MPYFTRELVSSRKNRSDNRNSGKVALVLPGRRGRREERRRCENNVVVPHFGKGGGETACPWGL